MASSLVAIVFALVAGCSRTPPVNYTDTELDPYRAAFDMPRPEGLPPFPRDADFHVGGGGARTGIDVRMDCGWRNLQFRQTEGVFECYEETIAVMSGRTYETIEGDRASEEITFHLQRQGNRLVCTSFNIWGDTPTPRSFEEAAALARDWMERCAGVPEGNASTAADPGSSGH